MSQERAYETNRSIVIFVFAGMLTFHIREFLLPELRMFDAHFSTPSDIFPAFRVFPRRVFPTGGDDASLAVRNRLAASNAADLKTLPSAIGG